MRIDYLFASLPNPADCNSNRIVVGVVRPWLIPAQTVTNRLGIHESVRLGIGNERKVSVV